MNAEPLHHTYFELGDTVQVRHLPDSPLMVVKHKLFEGDAYDPHTRRLTRRADLSKRKFESVLCFWFNSSGDYCELDYDYKDLDVKARARDTPKTLVA
jgi:hypothetical protein